MTRIAVLYDIHGNLPALDAVLAEIANERIDRIVIGGDIVPGPMPREALERLLNLETPIDFISGNCDRVVSAVLNGEEATEVPEQFRGNITWSAQQLDADQGNILRGWPATLRMTVPPIGEILFCHATPQNDRDIFTRETPEERLVPIFAPANAALVVCGHTHMQFDRMIGATRVVNAGSVGMPFAEPGAYWLLLDDDAHLRHTRYDLESAANAVRATSYPDSENFAARNILAPSSEAEMIRNFAGVAIT